MLSDSIMQQFSKIRATKDYLKIDELIDGHAYKIYARNAYVGIWVAKELGFLTSRYKVGDTPYLFVEYHWDTQDDVHFPYGTVKPLALIEPSPFDLKDDYSETEKNVIVDYVNRLERENPIIEGFNSWEHRKNTAMRFESRLSGDFRSNDQLFKLIKTKRAGREVTASISLLKKRGYSEAEINERLRNYKTVHPVLIGDSIFDNGHYVESGQSVTEQLQARLSDDDTVTLLAVDGAKIADVEKQLINLPAEASHVFISCGGNDVLYFLPELDQKINTVAEAFRLLFETGKTFREQYRSLLNSVKSRHQRVCVCTIYNSIPEDISIGINQEALSVLAFFNDIILQTAVEQQVPVIDLRVICNEPEDFSTVSVIEPSEQGGRKIIRTILTVMELHDFTENRCVIYR